MAILLCLILTFSFTPSTYAEEKSASQQYVEDMGSGWNLGNSFDAFDESNDRDETTWGNPKITKELIQAIKEKGFDSIRLPLTLHKRIGGLNENFVIKEDFLNRYEEVVKWALEEDLYVMINIHHDSWTWLADWDGETQSEEYLKYIFIWRQLAERFKNYDERLSFESINEPDFHTSDENKISYLTTLNEAFYQTIRQSGGNNFERMLVLPTVYTDTEQNKMDALYEQMIAWEDEHLIATVHYYGEWVYSTNIGKTRFNEILWDDVTPRSSLTEVFDRVAETFTENDIGVVIGEYGLLGYDKSDTVNQLGETLKYIEYINHYAREKELALMLWDNGQHINRNDFSWHTPRFGEMIEIAMNGRSAYSKNLDTYYLSKEQVGKELAIPLTLNGLEFKDITFEDKVLKVGEEYIYQDETVILSESIFEELINQDKHNIGKLNHLTIRFSEGVDWEIQFVYVDTPVFKKASSTTGKDFFIPVEFNGHHLENVQSKDENGKNVSTHDWWNFLEYGHEFTPLYEESRIQLSSQYTTLLKEGMYELTFTFFNGEEYLYNLIVKDGVIQGHGSTEENTHTKKTTQKEVEYSVSTNTTKENSNSRTLWLLVLIGIVLVTLGLGYESICMKDKRK